LVEAPAFRELASQEQGTRQANGHNGSASGAPPGPRILKRK
jgi:hypothetical protein